MLLFFFQVFVFILLLFFVFLATFPHEKVRRRLVHNAATGMLFPLRDQLFDTQPVSLLSKKELDILEKIIAAPDRSRRPQMFVLPPDRDALGNGGDRNGRSVSRVDGPEKSADIAQKRRGGFSLALLLALPMHMQKIEEGRE